MLKKLTALFVATIILQQASAQSNTLILAADETGTSKTNVACKEVRLKDGYRFTGQATTNMRAFIDPTMICNVDYLGGTGFTNNTMPALPSTAYPVGATPGSFAVTPSGAAVYNIPLTLSPGTAGMQPNLSVVYNSQGGDGLMGIGWNLAGLSAITRVGRNPYLDGGMIKPVTLTQTDRFALDGNRLIKFEDVGDVHYHNPTRHAYYTELENFSKITAQGIVGGSAQSFLVEAKDGSKMEYGKTSDSRIEPQGVAEGGVVLTWLLNKVTDAQGNYLTITYTENNATGEYYPKEINYTGNTAAGLTPYNSVKFKYGYRQDKQRAYVAGYALNSNVLLNAVEMYSGSTKMHEYNFNYALNMNSHLSEVIEKGSDGSQFNSTKIVWNENDKQIVNEVFNGTQMGGTYSINTVYPHFYTADVNGDGFGDLVYLKKEIAGHLGTYRVDINNKDGRFTFGQDQQFNVIGNSTTIGGFDRTIKPNSIVADLNGDGYEDMVVFSFDKRFKKMRCSYLRSTGTTLVEDSYFFEQNYDDLLVNDKDEARIKYAVGDFDGNGVADLGIYFHNKGRVYIISFVTKSVIAQLEQNVPTAGEKDLEAYAVDLNGDGKQEMLVTYINRFQNDWGYSWTYEVINGQLVNTNSNGQMGYPTGYHRVFPGDFNGDGKTDLLTWSNPDANGGGWQIGYSKGNKEQWFEAVPFDKSYNIGDPNTNLNANKIIILDCNGDGKSDIVDIYASLGGSPTFLNVNYSIGMSFVKYFAFDSNGYQLTEDGNPTGYIGDYDGDGKIEMFYSAGGGNIRKVSFLPDASKDIHKVKTIQDGLGNKLNIDFNTLPVLSTLGSPTEPRYAKGTGAFYPLNDIQKPITVAAASSRYHRWLGASEYDKMEYSYSGAKLHLQGKGFLGFTSFKTNNLTAGLLSQEVYETNQTLLSQRCWQPVPLQSKTSTAGGQLISEKNYSNYKFNIASGLIFNWNKRYYFYAQTITETDHLRGVTATTNLTQDVSGNVLTQSSNNGVATTSTTNTYATVNAWTASRLTSSTTTAQRTLTGEPAYTRSQSIAYNANGLPSSSTSDVGVVTTSVYNACGLPLSSKVSAPGLADRVNYTVYDATQRFALKSTNTLGHFSESTYDPAYGNVLSSKNANNLSSTSAYDGFGRLTQSTSPTGITSTVVLDWDINTPYLYTTTTQTPGDAWGKTYHDPLGRAIKAETKNFDGTLVSTTKTYNNQGQLMKATSPNNTGLATTYEYESDFKRLKKVTSPTGTIAQYTYNGLTTETKITDASGDKISSSTADAAGLVTTSTDANGGTLSYLYHSSGQPRQITAPGNAVTTITYDNFGRQIELNDPDAGITKYEYDKLGQLTKQQTAKQAIASSSYSTTLTYDVLGRILTKADPQEGTTTYIYDPTNAKGEVASVITSGKPDGFNTSISYTYDNFTRLKTKTEVIPGMAVNPVYTYEYDNLSRVTKTGYPSHTGANSFSVTNTYNTNGYLAESRNTGTGSLLWQCNTMNERGQVTDATWNTGLTYHETFSNLGFLQKQEVKSNGNSLVAFTYTFAPSTGNLMNRKGHNEYEEKFRYDKLDRLYMAYHSDPVLNQSVIDMKINYADNGNISNKWQVGDYVYGTVMPPAGPHAVTAINNPVAPIPSLTQNITYTAFNKAKTISEGTYSATLYYGTDEQRRKMETRNNGTIVSTKYYVGDYEKIESGSTIRELHYLGNAVYVRNTSGSTVTDTTYYLHKDHLGSLATVFISPSWGGAAEVVGKYSYDVWGRRRNYDNFTYTISSTLSNDYFGRFYTMHETVLSAAGGGAGGWGGGLINMNGRLYDPLLARMLSPDNYVQAAGNTQSYNRYSYCVNNPLKYTDPTGDITVWDVVAVVSIVAGVALAPMGIGYTLIGAGIVHFGNTLVPVINDGKNWNDASNWAGYNLTINVNMNSGSGAQREKEEKRKKIKMWEQEETQYDRLIARKNAGYNTNEPDYYACNGCPPNGSFPTAGTNTGGNVITKNDLPVLPGVHVTMDKGRNSGYFNPITKTVHLPEWLNTTSRNDMLDYTRHEYGHFLQLQKYGYADYFAISLTSMYSVINNPITHKDTWTEMEANYLSQQYFGAFSNPSKYPTLKPINK